MSVSQHFSKRGLEAEDREAGLSIAMKDIEFRKTGGRNSLKQVEF